MSLILSLLFAAGLSFALTPSAFSAAPDVSHHWAFQPVRRYSAPSVMNHAWPKTPVDFFILAKLEEKNISPAPAADRRTLIRRASFDLTGLPPDPEIVERFLRDDSPQAFGQVIDQLLASPAYGERWGRYWLDVARYADTKGYVYSDREEPRFVHSFVYRDWVIGALNADLPYDQFLLQQIAADKLVSDNSQRPDPSLAALGFLTLGRRFLGVVHDIIDDRIDVVMRGTQALTVGCARCHDHKFDPIPTKDYYSLYGVFNGCTEKMVALSIPNEATKAGAEFQAGLKERVDKYHQAYQARREEFSNRFRAKAAEYLVAVLDVKKLPTEEHYEIRGPDDLNPTVVRGWENYLLQTKERFDSVFAPWHELQSLGAEEFERKSAELLEKLSVPLDRSRSHEPAGAKGTNRINAEVLRALREKPLHSMRDVAQRYGRLFADLHTEWQSKIASANNALVAQRLVDDDREELRQVIYGVNAPVRVPDLAPADLEWYFDEKTRVELMKLHAEIERWIIKSPGAPPYSVILEDRPVQKNPRVFLRGNPANKGEAVPRRFLEVLAGRERRPFEKGSGRLELAQAIARADNPLTARVMANRIWLHHFGAGLVRTPSDFGTRSEPPTHPELLDWLALYFIDHGWSIKALHRLIMLSSVYQQSSDVERTREADPENRLLWRINRRRLDFEAIHDSMLTVTGELRRDMGGPPTDLFEAPFGKRRTVYGFVDRQFLPGVFRLFDFANPDMHNPQRPETTVPQQALFFMNSPFVIERARALLCRSDVQMIGDPERRIERLYELVYQRRPTPQQLGLGLSFVNAAAVEPPYQPPPPPPPVWTYGYGEVDSQTRAIKSFNPLPHFTGEAWQGGAQWPDEKLGWVRLTAGGGHAGNDQQHAAIRRWIARFNGVVSITGTIRHEHEAGDGVRASIISSREGLLGNWIVHKEKAETAVQKIEVQTGDTIDFVVDLNQNLNTDDFSWIPVIKVKENRDRIADYVKEWNSKEDFSGPPPVPPEPLNAWEKYGQVLLLSNEFMFVD